jgi:hypothetical protein
MSKHHKGGYHGKKWSSGSNRQAKTEVPVAGKITLSRNYKETSADRWGRNAVTSDLKHDEDRIDSNKQAGPPDEGRSHPVRQDGNIGEKERANSASHHVEDQASGTQLKHSAQSEYEELPADSNVTTAFGMSFLCTCQECQHDNTVLREMVFTHPKKDYYIGLLKQQRAEHEVKRNVVPKGLSPCAAAFKPPQQQKDSDIQAVCDRKSAKNQPSRSFPVVVSRRIHVLLVINGIKLQASGHHGY